MPILDLTGKKFGRLTVLRKDGRDRHGMRLWECACDCGKIIKTRKGALTSGRSKSCGCFNIEGRIQRATKHGMHLSPEYTAWRHMIDRCKNIKNKHFDDYGGRGITVCERWHNSFENFYADMGPRPSQKHSIDRIDNNCGYEPSNCRWATATTQALNKRKQMRNTSGYPGVWYSETERKWKAYIGIHRKRINLGTFSDKESAIVARKDAEIKYHHPLGN